MTPQLSAALLRGLYSGGSSASTRHRQHPPSESKLHMQNGWKCIYVKGDAISRGYMHGQALHKELAQLLDAFPQLLKRSNNISLAEYLELCKCVAWDVFCKKCPEWRDELEGMVHGALSKGVVISADFLFGLNMYLGSSAYFDPTIKKPPNFERAFHCDKWTHLPRKGRNHCSAFIATGDATKDGQIIMAHNTHCEFAWAAFSNVIAYVKPDKGHAFIMQTGPGLLCSSMDWFITDAGIIGCETTIADTTYLPEFGKPYFCRIRECMQYGNTLKEYERILTTDNAGDYPCGWLIGDIHSGEIAIIELGKDVVASRYTKSGIFYGANFAHDRKLREKETTNDREMDDLSTSLGARNSRFDWLLNKVHWGKLDEASAKEIIADHYDPKYGRVRKGDRGICLHAETEKIYRDWFGAIDGKVVSSNMAKHMQFWGRWGSSCGRAFRRPKNADKLVPSFKSEPWTILKSSSNNNASRRVYLRKQKTRKNKTMH